MDNNVTREQERIKKARGEIEKRTGKSPEELYKEREKRMTDAIQLKIPDRVPVSLRLGYFHLRYAGLKPSAGFYDPIAYKEAVMRVLTDFEADVFRGSNAVSGPALEKLDSKQYQWPGGSLRPDQDAQFLDMEIMKETEYDLLLTDPGDFILRYYLPRVWKALEPFSKLPSLLSLVGSSSMATQSARFTPEISQAFQTIFNAGQEQAQLGQSVEEISNRLGIPQEVYPGSEPPFDLFVSHLRGMRGVMVDLFKCPEKLLAGMERILEWRLARAVQAAPQERGRRVHAGGNHYSSEEYLSKKQFETFAWPTWKKSMLNAIDRGFVPSPFMEGKNDDRVECFLELPKGKAFVRFTQIDIVRAKEILGGHLCIMGGVPGSLMWGGSPQDVDEYCKKLIETCGKGGGFILSCPNVDDAKPANLKAMLDSVKKYGRYD